MNEVRSVETKKTRHEACESRMYNLASLNPEPEVHVAVGPNQGSGFSL